MPRLTRDTLVEKQADIISAEAGADVIMVSIENGQYYGVSQTARDIWELIGCPITVAEIVKHLVEKYGVKSDVCEEQTLAFLEQLQAEGLLQVKNAAIS